MENNFWGRYWGDKSSCMKRSTETEAIVNDKHVNYIDEINVTRRLVGTGENDIDGDNNSVQN